MNREKILLEIEELHLEKEDEILKIVNKVFDFFTKTDKKDPAWNWVKTEYCEAFKRKNHERGGRIKEATLRMKKMFAENPHIRKEDVMGTVKMYLNATDSRFVMFPHYFLKKGVGNNATYEFLNWYDKYMQQKDSHIGRTNKTNKMQ